MSTKIHQVLPMYVRHTSSQDRDNGKQLRRAQAAITVDTSPRPFTRIHDKKRSQRKPTTVSQDQRSGHNPPPAPPPRKKRPNEHSYHTAVYIHTFRTHTYIQLSQNRIIVYTSTRIIEHTRSGHKNNKKHLIVHTSRVLVRVSYT